MSINSKKRRDLKKKKQQKVQRMSEDKKQLNMMREMSRDHQDVLQNIEFILVTGAMQDPTVDDLCVGNALRALLYEKEFDDPRIKLIVEWLEDMREERDDVSDEIWNKGLKVVLDSVHTHSPMTEGSKGYLDFVKPFVLPTVKR